jgi:hypothetical protein
MGVLRWLLALLAGICIVAAAAAADPKVQEAEAAAKRAYAVAVQHAGTGEAPVAADPTTAQADKLTHEFLLEREHNKLLEAAFVSMLAVTLLFIVLRFLNSKGPSAVPHMVSATGLICIIFGTILLVLMAETESQLTASVGILGAVAGYLFRSMRADAEVRPNPRPEKPSPSG